MYCKRSRVEYEEIAKPLRLYAARGTSVTLKLHHLFSTGYQNEGSIGLSGQLQDAS
jgi:hypothetical protein